MPHHPAQLPIDFARPLMAARQEYEPDLTEISRRRKRSEIHRKLIAERARVLLLQDDLQKTGSASVRTQLARASAMFRALKTQAERIGGIQIPVI